MKHKRTLVAVLGIVFLALYRFRKRLYALLLALPPPRYRVVVSGELRVPMADGALLAIDHYAPLLTEKVPSILIRSPYGRGRRAGIFGLALTFIARRFAERGYHVIIQDTRGRFDSDGIFEPVVNERADGYATLNWLNQQPWFNGVVGLWGPSYLGIVQWAIADAPQVKALIPSLTSSRLYSIVYPDGALDLDLVLRWLALFHELDTNQSLLGAPRLLGRVEHAVTPAFRTLPVIEADAEVLGETSPLYHNWLCRTDPNDPLWQKATDTTHINEVTAPSHLIGGWYDFFLRGLLADYASLRAAGRTPYLTIGPWYHFSRGFVMFDTLSESLTWFDAHLKGERSRLRTKPVRLYVMGANEWRDFAEWPPPAKARRYYLKSNGRLSQEQPTGLDTPDHYCYDPSDPTPAVGGAQFSPGAGPRDNRALEARPDVLTYTTAPLERDIEIIGPVSLDLFARSSLKTTDFFGRLCDVHRDGRSINICDGLFRIAPPHDQRQPDGSLRLTVDMWATAHRFRRGHRLRLQVSSGAHPHWTRNLGTGEPVSTSKVMRVAEQTVYHDHDHPSALILPVTSA